MPATHRRTPRAATVALLLVLTVVVVAADQITKQIALSHLTPGEYHPIIGSTFGFSLVFNSGAAFSFAEGSTWVFTIAAVVVVAVIIKLAARLSSIAWTITLAALLGGALGNLIDRLLREPGFGVGHVVDFINYNGWFVGNVADIAIVLAAIAIAVLSFCGIRIDGRRQLAAIVDEEESEAESVPEGDPAAHEAENGQGD